MTLRRKLWILILASSITGFILLFGIAALIGSLFNQGYTHESIKQIGEQLLADIESSGNPEEITAHFSDFVASHPAFKLYWFDQNGDVNYASDSRQQSFEMDEILSHFSNMPESLWEAEQDSSFVFPWNAGGKPQYLLMVVPSEAMQGSQIFFYVQDNQEFIQLLIPVALFFITPYIFALFFFSRLNRRLKRLNQAMKEFDTEGSMTQIEDHSRDEIGQLNRNFNEMADRIKSNVIQIQELESKRKSLIANISHDLRTPMTMIIGYIETLQSNIVKNEEEKKEYFDIILRRSKYMDQLLEKLLEISQLDTYKSRIRLKELDIGEQLRVIAADYFHVIEAKQIFFDVQITEEPVIVSIDPQLVERAIRNLMENAIQYGGDGKYLGLSLRETTDEIIVAISDYGKGIPEEMQNQIFERFYRGSKARTGDGLGLGLSIVQEVAAAHHGRVEVESIPDQKTCFRFIVPK